MHRGGSYSNNLARCHTDTDAAAAHGDTKFGIARGNGVPNGFAEVWIVNRRGVVGPEIDYLMPARSEMVANFFLEIESCVI